MNDFDKDNLEWFTNASAKEQREFLENAEISDLVYMIGLVRQAISSLHEEELEVINADVIAEGCKEANAVLRKFRLNK